MTGGQDGGITLWCLGSRRRFEVWDDVVDALDRATDGLTGGTPIQEGGGCSSDDVEAVSD